MIFYYQCIIFLRDTVEIGFQLFDNIFNINVLLGGVISCLSFSPYSPAGNVHVSAWMTFFHFRH